MGIASRIVQVGSAVLLAVQATFAVAQVSVEKLRQELIAPWLMTVQGEARTRLLRINEIAEESQGSYLFNATWGFTDGTQVVVRVELIQAGKDLNLLVRSAAETLVSLRQSPDGNFAGVLKYARGAEKPVTLEKLSEQEVPQKVKEAAAKTAAQVFADEARDWGVAPRKQPRTDRYHAPTPTELPGAKTIRAMELRAMQSQSPAPVLIDVLGGNGHRTIRGAYWLNGAGLGTDTATERLRLDLEKLTGGRKAAPIVFFCLNSECWLSYNAGLRAIELGYTNVHWFRGGTVAWERAEFEMIEAIPYRR